jgi:hypothetical protein
VQLLQRLQHADVCAALRAATSENQAHLRSSCRSGSKQKRSEGGARAHASTVGRRPSSEKVDDLLAVPAGSDSIFVHGRYDFGTLLTSAGGTPG